MLCGNKTTGVIRNLGNLLTLLEPKAGVRISIKSELRNLCTPIERTQVQMFLRRVARSEAGTQEAGATE